MMVQPHLAGQELHFPHLRQDSLQLSEIPKAVVLEAWRCDRQS